MYLLVPVFVSCFIARSSKKMSIYSVNCLGTFDKSFSYYKLGSNRTYKGYIGITDPKAYKAAT